MINAGFERSLRLKFAFRDIIKSIIKNVINLTKIDKLQVIKFEYLLQLAVKHLRVVVS